ncbi:hypothetical protein G7Y89_g10051 [Cudoniella acicularis]|uniref:Uncharacterized protein n=1 Tax=Cudoniella acicularis TaxID=354080 RepID=A0A8H4VZF4_9HELO|nr:hypothetical protein G7Y89_g10051 [Cudoniella acicularis]
MGRLSSVSSSFTLWALVLVTSAAAAALKNYTISVPVGTSDHNDPTLLCTPAGWQEIIVFYLGNYVAHIATVVSRPGESALCSTMTRIAALLCPTSGLLRGLSTITTFASFAKTDLRKAARARALCMVIRSWDWEPRPGDVVTGASIANLKVSPKSTTGSIDASASVYVYDFLRSPLCEKNGYPTIIYDETIHGLSKLPKGYNWAFVSHDVEFDDDFTPSNPATKPPANFMSALSSVFSPSPQGLTSISSSYNLVGGLVSLGQTLYTSATLYQTQGDQINQYGFAAFGLTVAPFVMMSIINLMANCLAPSYPALYMVETSVMLEAKGREGCQIVGEVAKLKEALDTDRDSSEGREWVPSATFEKSSDNDDLFINIVLCIRTGSLDHSAQQTIPLVVGEEDKSLIPKIVEKGLQVAGQESLIVRLRATETIRLIDGAHERCLLYIPSCPQVGLLVTEKYKLPEYLSFLLATVLALVPIAVIGALSHFQRQKSTHSQRGWTMTGIENEKPEFNAAV